MGCRATTWARSADGERSNTGVCVLPSRRAMAAASAAAQRTGCRGHISSTVDLPSTVAATVFRWHPHRGTFAWCYQFGCCGVDDRPWTRSGRARAIVQCTRGVRVTCGGRSGAASVVVSVRVTVIAISTASERTYPPRTPIRTILSRSGGSPN